MGLVDDWLAREIDIRMMSVSVSVEAEVEVRAEFGNIQKLLGECLILTQGSLNSHKTEISFLTKYFPP